MENFTHTFCGLALARAGLDRLGPAATVTVVIAANLPDVDVFYTMPAGKPTYLVHHRGVTHAIAGLVVLAPALAAIVWAIARRFGRVDPERPLRYRDLLLAASIGALSHPLLDLTNVYGVRPWLPFDGTWYYGDVLFIADPWLWIGFGGAAFVAAPPRPRWAHAPWAAFAAAAIAVMVASGRAPIGVPIVWTLLAVAAVAARANGLGADRRRRSVALGGIAAVLLYIAATGVASRVAERRGLEAIARVIPAGETVESSCPIPQPGVPTRFEVLVATRERVYRAPVSVLGGSVGPVGAIARGLDDPAAAALEGTPEHHAWRVFARYPFVARTDHGELVLGDARYVPLPIEAWCNFCVPLPTGARPRPDAEPVRPRTSRPAAAPRSGR